MKTPWTISSREEVIAILWMLLYYTSKDQAADITRYFFIFMAIVSFIAVVHYKSKDN
jgi:hypothetical protein